MPGLPAQGSFDDPQTVRILERILQGRISKAEASRKLGVSRKTIYKWLQYYERNRLNIASLQAQVKNRKQEFKNQILRLIVANPALGPNKIASEISKRGKKISNRSVWLILKKMKLNTIEHRQDYAYNFKKASQAQDPKYPGHLRLQAQARKRMVEEVILSGRKVEEVIKEYGVSRKTYAKWKKRYQKASEDKENILFALSDQHPKGEKHPNGASDRKVKAVIGVVVTKPELSSAKIAKKLGFIGNHGVQNILNRNNLNRYEMRLAYARAQKAVPKPIFARILNRIRLVWEQFIPSLAPAPPPVLSRVVQALKTFTLASIITLAASYSFFTWINFLSSQRPIAAIGLIFSSVALFMGSIFFLYSLKYYITLAIVLSFSQQEIAAGRERTGKSGFFSWLLGLQGQQSGEPPGPEGDRRSIGLTPNLEHITLKRQPFVSVHIPLFNEKKVVERAIAAATNFDYPEYEVVLADDSTDGTSTIIRDHQRKYLAKGEALKETRGEGWVLSQVEVKPGVVLKHLHRTSRSGFKGGALRLALKVTDPKAEFVSVFDADFVPYPDTLELFLKYFQATAGTLDFRSQRLEVRKEKLSSNVLSSNTSNIAAVQGYQWHVLNKSENWVTRGVRSEYAGSYVIERSGTEIYSGLKQISGAVYMIRRDVLEEVGWETSITEDFELTLKLYERGYKVVYTPYIQAPAECVSTLKRLVRQRMRWAEGHSNNVKKMLTRLLFSNNLTTTEKLEVLYLSPYYLQAFFFLVGTISWLISETIFQAGLPFWTSLWGWSLVLTNLLSLPLMNAVGLFLEESEERDYGGIASFVLLSYILVPFQAYAALKGFIEKEEGPWFRTPKTGHITDVFTRGRFYRFISGILPGHSAPAPISTDASRFAQKSASLSSKISANQYVALATANNRFNSFGIRPRRVRWAGRGVVSLILIFSLGLSVLGTRVPVGEAPRSSIGLAMPPIDVEDREEKHSSAKPLILTGEKSNFRLDEHPEFVIKTGEGKETSKGFSFLPKSVYAQGEDIIETEVFFGGKRAYIPTDVVSDGKGQFTARLYFPGGGFRPGKYRLEASFGEGEERYWGAQDFTWGVLAINTNKSIYLYHEEALIGMAVLDDEGHTICDANLELSVKRQASSAEETVFSTENGTITRSPECGPKTVTNTADYSVVNEVGEVGIYSLKLIAETKNGTREIEDSFEVRESVPFDVERKGPTRIYPWADYEMKLKIEANQDFRGQVIEKVPKNFEFVGKRAFSVKRSREEGIQRLVWEVDWKKGKTYELFYEFDAPDISPYLYLLGPLKIGDFQEIRQWQIAADAEVLVETTMYDSTDEYGPSPNTVCISQTTCYVFYQKTQGSRAEVVYSKTTNADQASPTWAASVAIDAPGSGSTTFRPFGVWYDQWTPGDTTGTVIHIFAPSYDTDEAHYNYLDTNGDTTRGSWAATPTWSFENSPDGATTITKSTDGNLFGAGFGNATGDQLDVFKSIDSGATWSVITPSYSFIADDEDQVQLLPLSGGDILMIYWDHTGTDLYSAVYDEATDTWDGSSITIDANIAYGGSPACTATDATCGDWGATVDKSTGNIYLAANNNSVAAGGDLKAYKYTESSRTWGNLTDIYTDIGTAGEDVKMAYDEYNDYLYAVYLRGSDTARHVYYKKSTDDGSTWDSEVQISGATARDLTTVDINIMSDILLYAVWFVENNDMYGNMLVVVPEYTWIFFGIGPLLPGAIAIIRKKRK